jgi:hypothetical protein
MRRGLAGFALPRVIIRSATSAHFSEAYCLPSGIVSSWQPEQALATRSSVAVAVSVAGT